MSLFADIRTMNEGTKFVNVIGSTNDPLVTEHSLDSSNISHRPLSWLELWDKTCNGERVGVKCIACKEKRRAEVGAHVVLRETGSDLPRNAKQLIGSNRVFIVPMCKVCNGQDWDSRGEEKKEKVFSAQRTINIVRLWAFGKPCELNQSRFVVGHPEFDDDDNDDAFWKALNKAEAEYENDLNEKKGSEGVLNKDDEKVLGIAFSALPSGPSQGSSSTGSSQGASVTQPAGSSRRSPMAQPSDPSQGSSPYSMASRLPPSRPLDFWKPDVLGVG